MEIIKAKKEDFKRILPFINKIFYKNFPKLLPKFYLSDDICRYHYLAVEDGKILGTLASIPNVFHIPGGEIKAYGIGMVSVDQNARGKGVMNALMSTAVSQAKTEGGEIAYLSGNRQRYERYGFVPSGSKTVFEFSSDNFKYMPSDNNITIKSGMTEDEEKLAKDIFYANEYRFDREDFLYCLQSWKNKSFCVYNGKELIGYGVLGKHKCVKELNVKKEYTDLLASVVFALQIFHNHLFIEVESWRKDYIRKLSEFAGKYRLDYCDDFCILNYVSVIEKLMNVKENTDGVYSFSVVNDGTYTIRVTGGKATVEKSQDKCDNVFTSSEATIAMFSGLSGAFALPSWFSDLELYMSDPDNV